MCPTSQNGSLVDVEEMFHMRLDGCRHVFDCEEEDLFGDEVADELPEDRSRAGSERAASDGLAADEDVVESKHLSGHLAAIVESDRRLAKRIKKLPRESKERKEAQRQMRNEKQRLKREMLQETRETWTDEQAVADIESQLQGKGFVKSVAVHRPCPPQRPAQKRLLKALTAPLVMTLEAQYRRRDNAIDAIVAYCTVQEGCTLKLDTVPASPGNPPEGTRLHDALSSGFFTNTKERPRRCFICIGQAFSLPRDDGHQLDVLTREFYSSNDLTKHFRRKHMSKVADGDKIECKACDVMINNFNKKVHFNKKMHF
ncbi:hypothetical protein K4K49_004658 [Colletotrichum sp. SAR 10_70]|nr:hypothetical protein K4K50_011428 [Colletotrichum sp. SAR 10_71]KAI8170248.1 hypothetical protein K4K49_004658 [Colletotrichum sp. SAR 10_70]